MSVLGATHQHWRSTMLSSISYVSERCGRISRWCALRGPLTMPRPRDSRRERGKKNILPQPREIHLWSALSFFYNVPIQLPGPCYTVCKREDASNSAVVTYNADMSCPAGHRRLSGSHFQELHIFCGPKLRGSKLLHCAATAAIGHWRKTSRHRVDRAEEGIHRHA